MDLGKIPLQGSHLAGSWQPGVGGTWTAALRLGTIALCPGLDQPRCRAALGHMCPHHHHTVSCDSLCPHRSKNVSHIMKSVRVAMALRADFSQVAGFDLVRDSVPALGGLHRGPSGPARPVLSAGPPERPAAGDRPRDRVAEGAGKGRSR